MKYCGFNVTSCIDTGIERHNYSTHQTDICEGFYCQVYPASDEVFANQIDDFCLAVDYEIPDSSDASLTAGIIDYVNEHYSELQSGKDKIERQHRDDLIGKLVCLLGESESGADLYDTLSDYIGMSDMDILSTGFKTLVPFFNRDYYAESIADYICETGTEQTTTGNWIIPFSEICEKFAVNLNEDDEMLKMICDRLDNSIIVADMDTSNNEFDIVYYTAYCPNLDENISDGMEMS